MQQARVHAPCITMRSLTLAHHAPTLLNAYVCIPTINHTYAWGYELRVARMAEAQSTAAGQGAPEAESRAISLVYQTGCLERKEYVCKEASTNLEAGVDHSALAPCATEFAYWKI